MPKEDFCKIYEKHKKEFSDFNLLGQAYRLLCQLSKTNFDNEEDVKLLKFVAKDVARTIEKLTEVW